MSMHLYRTTLASLALPLAVASVSLAQVAQPPDPGIQKDVASQMKRETPTPVRASKLIGMEVYSRSDKELGTIKDVVLDQDGRTTGYAVVSYGGFLGLGDKLFAIPYRNLDYSGVKNSKVYIDLDEQTLKNAPGFSPDNWPDKADSMTYYRQADQYYDKNSTARPAAGRMEGAAAMPEGLMWTRRVSSLIGTDVQSPTGESLGEIKDVVVDWRTGKVLYDVLSFGGIMGMGDKLFAIPTTALHTKPDSKELVLAIDKQRLKDAPGFDKDNWPNFADQSWQQTNDQFYSAPGMTPAR